MRFVLAFKQQAAVSRNSRNRVETKKKKELNLRNENNMLNVCTIVGHSKKSINLVNISFQYRKQRTIEKVGDFYPSVQII